MAALIAILKNYMKRITVILNPGNEIFNEFIFSRRITRNLYNLLNSFNSLTQANITEPLLF